MLPDPGARVNPAALLRYSADPGGMIRHAAERDWMQTNAPPSLRALESAPQTMQQDLAERFNIRPPRVPR